MGANPTGDDDTPVAQVPTRGMRVMHVPKVLSVARNLGKVEGRVQSSMGTLEHIIYDCGNRVNPGIGCLSVMVARLAHTQVAMVRFHLI